MQLDQYTPDTIAQCMGLPGFNLQASETGLRVLLQPSFHPEVCITFTSTEPQAKVEVVAARGIIFRQLQPAPMLTDRCEAFVPSAVLVQLAADLTSAIEPIAGRGVSGIAIDGMPSDLLIVGNHAPSIRVTHNVGRRDELSLLVGKLISIAWNCVGNCFCKNALAEAAKYAALDLPYCDTPPRKPTIETIVLGPTEDKQELIDALKNHFRQ